MKYEVQSAERGVRRAAEPAPNAKTGATLIATLGILTVLTMLIIGFFVSSRIHRQTSASDQYRATARNQLDEALFLAMRYVDEAMTPPNYPSEFEGENTTAFGISSAFGSYQRLAPIRSLSGEDLGPWFREEFSDNRNYNTEEFEWQAPEVLTSPTLLGTNNVYVNLLTPQVLRLLPPILTNQLAELLNPDNENPRPLRSGWFQFDPVLYAPDDIKLLTHPSRIAFAMFNCSSLFDANYFGYVPPAEKWATTCFNQADVTNWVKWATSEGTLFTNLQGLAGVDVDIPELAPFSFLSYDPGPDVYPLTLGRRNPGLGTHRFNARPAFDLNDPRDLLPLYLQSNLVDAYQHPALLTKGGADGAVYSKFNINSITNFCPTLDSWGRITTPPRGDTGRGTPWYNSADFRSEWLDPVTFLLKLSLTDNWWDGDPRRIPGFRDDDTPLATFSWAVANHIEAGRVPRVSDFPTTDNPEPDIYTRADYAVKDVPLINKVHVFNVFDPQAPQGPAYYDFLNGGGIDPALSNHYAVAIELWYPFAPHEPPEDAWLYVGVVTNAMEATTTTNRSWNSNELADWFAWRDAGRNLTSMQILFEQWSEQYRTSSVSNKFLNVYSSAQTVGFDYYYTQRRGWVWEQRKEDHTLWQIITGDKDLWFTAGMPGHPSWPGTDEDGTVLIQDTPIWQAFYPETDSNGYAEGITATNYYIAWLTGTETDDGEVFVTTNRLSGIRWEDYYTHLYLGDMYFGDTSSPCPTLLWTGTNTYLLGGTTASGNYLDLTTDLVTPTPLTKIYKRLLSLSTDYGGTDISLVVNHVTTVLTPYTVITNVFGATYRQWGGGPGSPTAERVTNERITTNRVTSLVLSNTRDPSTNFTAHVVSAPMLPIVDVDAEHILFVDYEVLTEVPPLPREGVEYMWDALDGLFGLMPTNSLSALQDFLMLRPSDGGYLDAPFLDFFNDNLSSINRLLRTHQTPGRFGGQRGYNYIELPPPGAGNEWVDVADARQDTETYGIYYTVFPKMYVCFPEVEMVPTLDLEGVETGESQAVTNYFQLGDKDYRLWVNPAVALEDDENRYLGEERVGHVFLDNGEEAGCIVDEALLTRTQESDFLPVEWNSVGLTYAPDPRRNAWGEPERGQWIWMRTFPDERDADDNPVYIPDRIMHYDRSDRNASDLENYNWAVKELPFILPRTPFQSIGDLGHVYIPYRNYRSNRGGQPGPNEMLACDTVTFATRSGATLLDIFTVAPESKPRYGLVQPNTLLEPVVKTLLSDAQTGWTNNVGYSDTQALLRDDFAHMDTLTEIYTNAIITAPFGMGWRSYADMMPMLLSFNLFPDSAQTAPERNELDAIRNDLEQQLKNSKHARHDYLEDITRGLIDKVSFRQNVYMVVVAAQTLSRSSTPEKAVVLADQRALVTVIRDAWSGRWVIHNWKWLTE